MHSGSPEQGFTLRQMALVVLLLALLMVIVALWPVLTLPVVLIAVVLLSWVIASTNQYRRYERLIFFVILPGLLAFIVVSWLTFSWLNSPLAAPLVEDGSLSPFAAQPSNRAFLAILVGLAAALLIDWVLRRVYFLMHEDLIMALTGLKREEADVILQALFLNLNRPYQIVGDGKIETTKPAGVWARVGGPGMLTVRPGNAVIMERGGKVTRVLLGGMHRTERFERVWKIVNLLGRDNIPDVGGRKDHWAKNVLTKDGIPLDIELQVFFRIRRQHDPSDPYKVDSEDVKKAAFSVGNWEAVIPLIAVDYLRNVVGQKRLDELFEPSSLNKLPILRGDIARSIQEDVKRDAADFGVEVSEIAIGEIEMPEEIRQRLTQRWLTYGMLELKAAESKAEAEALTNIEKARADAQATMVASVCQNAQPGRHRGPEVLASDSVASFFGNAARNRQ